MGQQMMSIGGWTGVPRCILCNVEKTGGAAGDDHDLDCIVGKSLYAVPTDAHGPSAGGPDGDSQRVDFISCLDTATMEWFMPSFRGDPPGTMQYGHTLTPIGLHVLMFGGWDGTRASNEVITLAFPSPPQKKGEGPGGVEGGDYLENEPGEYTPTDEYGGQMQEQYDMGAQAKYGEGAY